MEIDTHVPTFDAYDAYFYVPEDLKNEYCGKTVRNNSRKFTKYIIKQIIYINRKNNKHLTLIDVLFGFTPTGTIEHTSLLSDDVFASVIELLEKHNVAKKQNKKETFYYVPVIGLYEKFDAKKNKYIYSTNTVEEKYPIFNNDDVVEYRVFSVLLSNTKYYFKNNTQKKIIQQTDKNHRRAKYGRKSNYKNYDE
jgi:hypothetical protein